MKIKVFQNRIKVDIKDDFQKAQEYFARHGLPIQWEFKDVDVKGYKIITQDFGSVGTRLQIEGHEKLITLSKEHITIFAFNGNEFPLSKIPTSKCETFGAGVLVTLMTYKEGDVMGETYNTLLHEMMHAINRQLSFTGINLMDPMDIFIKNGVYYKYYKNDQPDAPDSNFGEAWKILTPHLDKLFPQESNLYKPANFKLNELVPQAVIDKLGEKSWELLDERMLRNLQFFRDNLGAIMVNSPTQQFRCFDPNEFRPPGLSQHNHGRAVDCTFKNYTSEQVRDWLRKPENSSRLPEPDIWVELGVPHFHFDVRYSDKKGVYFFLP